MDVDSSKFGQRMLEKMGWKNGKGLGRDEDGLVEHIKVTKKKDMSGKQTERPANDVIPFSRRRSREIEFGR